jgi:chromosome segregation ATPase
MPDYPDNESFKFAADTKNTMRGLRKTYTDAKTALSKLESDIKTKKMKWMREKNMNDLKKDANATPDTSKEDDLKSAYETAKGDRTAAKDAVTTAKSAISNEIDRIDLVIDGIKSDMSNVLDEISTNEDEISEYESKIKEIKADIKQILAVDIDEDISSMEDTMDATNDSIAELMQWIRDAKTDLVKAKATIDKYTVEINMAKSAIRPADVKMPAEEVEAPKKESVKPMVMDDDSDDDDSDDDDVVCHVVQKPEPSLLEKVIDLLKPKVNSADNTKETLTLLLTAIQKQNSAVSNLVNNSELKKVNDMLDNALLLLKK